MFADSSRSGKKNFVIKNHFHLDGRRWNESRRSDWEKKHFSFLILCIIVRGFVWYIFPLLCPPLLLVANVSQIPWKSLSLTHPTPWGRTSRIFRIRRHTIFLPLAFFLSSSADYNGTDMKGTQSIYFLPFIQFLMANSCDWAGSRDGIWNFKFDEYFEWFVVSQGCSTFEDRKSQRTHSIFLPFIKSFLLEIESLAISNDWLFIIIY